MIKITRGFQFSLKVKNEYCILVLKSDQNKIVISGIERRNNEWYLIADSQTTTGFVPGTYSYQLLDNIDILQSGQAQVIQNYLLSDETQTVKSRNQILLDAVEAQLAGTATQAQSSISVGDKSISYMSISELLKLREYYKAKVDQEEGKHNKNDQSKIIYKWRSI